MRIFPSLQMVGISKILSFRPMENFRSNTSGLILVKQFLASPNAYRFISIDTNTISWRFYCRRSFHAEHSVWYLLENGRHNNTLILSNSAKNGKYNLVAMISRLLKKYPERDHVKNETSVLFRIIDKRFLTYPPVSRTEVLYSNVVYLYTQE